MVWGLDHSGSQPSVICLRLGLVICIALCATIQSHSYVCSDCGAVVHKHCEYRSPACKAQIESGSYVTMSRKKIVKALDDLDDLAQFLLHKISLLNSDGSSVSKVDQVFETALFELHNSLVSTYSLTLQVCVQNILYRPCFLILFVWLCA